MSKENIFDIDDLMMMASIGAKNLEMQKGGEAQSIFELLSVFCPEPSSGPQIGLAMAKFTQGDVHEAISILCNLLKKYPDSADTYAHLALINSSLGNTQLASDQVELAIKYQKGDHLENIISKVDSRYFEPIL